MKKIIISIGAIIGLLIIGSIVSVRVPLPESVQAVAMVNGSKIEKEIFDSYMEQILNTQGLKDDTLDENKKTQIKDSIVNLLISQKLLEQAAIASGTTITQKEVEAQFNGVKVQFENPDEFYQLLASQDMTEEEFKHQIQTDLLIQKYTEEKIESMVLTMSSEELEQIYQTMSVDDIDEDIEMTEEEMRARVMRQNAQKFTFELIEQLKKSSQIEILI